MSLASLRLVPAVLASLVLAACSGSSDSAASSGGGGGAGGEPADDSGTGGADAAADAPAAPKIPFACNGQAVASGQNDGFQVDGAARSFFVDFPSDTSQPLPVIFSWHGFGDTATNFRNLLDPNGAPGFPFILVTPESTHLFPPQGLEWQLFDGAAADANPDAALFESVLGCLAESNNVDASRIYSIGFSAGAIMTDLLHSRYPKVLAATLAFSGAWFDDPAETAGVNTMGIAVNFAWDPLAPADRGAVLLTHGGANDQYGIIAGQPIISFEDAAQSAIPFLKAGGRTVIECAHTAGHQPDPNLTNQAVYTFFKAHQLGQPSPYAGGTMDPIFPSTCTLHTP